MIFKVLFLGDSNVGKSCLIKRFIDDKFYNDLSSTICVDFKIKKVDEEKVKIYIWEITSLNYCNSFFKNAEGIFIIFDVTNKKSFLNLPKYINYVNKLNIPIVILGTKIDCVEKREISHEEAKNFTDSMNLHYLEISSKESKIENIHQIFNIMFTEIECVQNQKSKNDLVEKKKKKKKCVIL